MKINTHRFGELEIDEQALIELDGGLVGMPQRRRFALLEFDREVPLAWLQCVDDPDFGLPVAEPPIFGQDRGVEIPRDVVEALDLRDAEECALLIVTTVHAGGVMVTGNLRAPLVVNTRTRRGRQIILDRPDLDMRALVDPVAFSQASLPELVGAAEQAAAPQEV